MLRSRFSLQNKYVAPLAVVIVGLLAYGWVVTFQYAQFDDDMLVTDRAAYLASPHSLLDAFTKGYWSETRVLVENEYYRPLITVSYILDTLIAPGSPAMAHLTNLLIHLATSLALLALFRRMLKNDATAVLLAILFACHPLASSVNGWIAGRNDSLMCLFAVLSFLGFLGYVRRESVLSLIGFGVAFAGAVLSKETALLLPVIFVLWLLVERDDRIAMRWIPPALAAAGLCAVWWIVRSHVITPAAHRPAFAPLTAAAVLLQGIGKVLLPVNLSVLATVSDVSFVYGILACAVVGFLAWRTYTLNLPRLAFGLAWFTAFLVPSLLTSYGSGTLVLECRLYLPIIGVLLILAELSPFREFEWSRRKAMMAGGGVIILIILSNWFAAPFRGPESTWTNAVEHAPSSTLSHASYASYLWKAGKTWEAEAEYKEALRIDSSNTSARADLGELMRARGSLDSAESHFWEQIRSDNSMPFSWIGLAEIAVQRRNPARALELLKEAVKVDAKVPETWMFMGEVYMMLDNRKGATECARKLRAMSAPIPRDVLQYLNRR